MAEERTRFQKIILLLLVVMIMLFGILTGVSRANRGVLFEGALLRASASPGQTVYSGKAHGDSVIVTVTPGGSATAVEFVIGDRFHDICSVEYPLEHIRTEYGGTVPGIRIVKNGEVLFEGGYDETAEYSWYDSDGTLSMAGVFGFMADSGASWSGYETTAPDVMRFAQGPELTARGSWWLYLTMVFLTLLLALDVTFPRALFYLQHCFAVRNPEPSDNYLFMQKAGWVIYSFLLLIGYIWALLQFP